MKFYHLSEKTVGEYASAYPKGCWKEYPSGLIRRSMDDVKGIHFCKECRGPMIERVPPLIIEWAKGSDIIPDYMKIGASAVVFTDKFKRIVEENNLTGLGFLPIEMVQSPRVKRPERISKRNIKMVYLPYEGPLLWDVINDNWCNMNLEYSGYKIKSKCSICNNMRYYLPTDTNKLVIEYSERPTTDFFRLHQITIPYFCSEKAFEILKKYDLINLTFKERGKIESF